MSNLHGSIGGRIKKLIEKANEYLGEACTVEVEPLTQWKQVNQCQ